MGKNMENYLGGYDAICISISGGKDSQTILGVVMKLVKAQGYRGELLAVHADTGAEWPESLPHCQMLCDHYRIPLVVANPHRSLPDHIERRCKMLTEQGRRGGWPSPACRYCTSDCKRNPIHSVICNRWPAARLNNILSVTGERREESRHRAALADVEPVKALRAGMRTVTSWRPILDYSLEQVWRHISDTGIPRHVAYDRGNERLSCAICVMACEGDIRNGAIARPDLAEHFMRIERETGQTFRHKKTLGQILAKTTKGGKA